MSDIKLVLLDDAGIHEERYQAILVDSSYRDRVAVFGLHNYGNGDENDNIGWWVKDLSPYGKIHQLIKQSSFRQAHSWLTEYGEIDLTNEIEYEAGWRSNRRLLRTLREGYSGGLIWDAFDNFHKHDTAWTEFGLLRTDTVNWKYTPKKRFYATKQVYRYVKPGYQITQMTASKNSKYDVYADLHAPLRNIRLFAFVSPNKKDFTIVGMSNVEADVKLKVQLQNLATGGKELKVRQYRTSPTENCELVEEVPVKDGSFQTTVQHHTIFTLTTLE